jgi:hypothetical protein
MIQRCNGTRLTPKPLAEFLRRSFDGHDAVERSRC